jgi:hypothetical protein
MRLGWVCTIYFQYNYYWNHACHKNYIVDDEKFTLKFRRTRKRAQETR